MARKQWKVDVERFEGDDKTGLLLENLRYAGVIGNVKCDYNEDMTKSFYSFSIYEPKGINAPIWADMNTRRMRTFGIKAEAKKY